MNTTKKLIATLLIMCMVIRLPESEAKASEAADQFISADINSEYMLADPDHTTCTGIYTIISPCYTFQITFSDTTGNGTLDIYDTHSSYNQIFDDEYETLPWKNVSEPPQIGVLIPVLHF